MGLFTNVIDKAVARVVSKTASVGFSPSDRNLWSVLGDWVTGKEYVDLATLLKYYETNPLVFEVLDKVGKNTSQIPLKVEGVNGKEVKNSRVLELITKELRKRITLSRAACGNYFVYFRKGIGAGEELEFWVASKVTITTSTTTGDVVKYEYAKPNGTTLTVMGDDLDNVLHIKNDKITTNNNVDIGLSNLQPMKDVVESSKEKFVADTSMVKNGGAKGIVSNDSEIPLLEKDRLEQQAQFDKNTKGAEKWGGLYVTANKTKFTPIGASSADLQILEGIIENLRRLASAYQLSSVLFNDVANSKFDNMEEAIKQAYLNCYIPTAEEDYIPLFVWLSERMGVNEGVLTVDKTQIEVIKSSTNVIAMALSDYDVTIQRQLVGQMSRDEARELLTLGALPKGVEVIGVGSTKTPTNEGKENV